MSYLENLEKNTTITNTKGGKYYAGTYDANLDIFAGISRYNDTDEIINKYKKALAEDKTLALANLLYLLDIRNGKGERLLFKTVFRYLCQNEKDLALIVLPKIPEFGRWDYVLEGLNTLIDKEVVEMIKEQLEKDKTSENPSLLAKWLPSHRTHNVKNEIAKDLIKKLGINEKEYRKTLTEIRKKLKLIETNLTNRDYENINFESVPTKAMLKYKESFNRNCNEKYIQYLNAVKKGEKKINTTGLYCYEIVRNIILGLPVDRDLLNIMWENQKDILNGYDKNIMVIADTSGSMQTPNNLPLSNAVGLAIYIAERNNGAFKDHFITFSENPQMRHIVGKDIVDKVSSFEWEVANTDIDKVFELLLNTAEQNRIKQDELPSHLIIISDMEFDEGVYSKQGTNFDGWKKVFEEKGYKLPKIIFWNVAGNTMGVPATKFDNDVAMVSGFSTAILENILTLENYTPFDIMLDTLEKYVKILQEEVA